MTWKRVLRIAPHTGVSALLITAAVVVGLRLAGVGADLDPVAPAGDERQATGLRTAEQGELEAVVGRFLAAWSDRRHRDMYQSSPPPAAKV